MKTILAKTGNYLKAIGAAVRGAAPARPGAAGMNAELMKYIVPAARSRWMAAGVAFYTPQQIENVWRMALAGDLTSQWEMFDLMESTWPELSSALNELKDSAIQWDYEVKPWALRGEDPTPEAVRRAKLVDELLFSMCPRPDMDENDFEDTFRDVLDARGKGISVLEVEFEARQISTGRAIAPRATRWVHPSWYGYPAGAQSGQLMLRAGGNSINPYSGPATAGDFITFPPHKFIVGVCKNKTGHPLGAAMLHVLGFWWGASNFAGEWFLNFAQIFGQPIRWANYSTDMDQADQAKLQGILENMGSCAWGMFPEGTQFELKEAMKAGQDNPQMTLINAANKVCTLVVLRQTLTSDVSQAGGSRALGEVHERKESGVKMTVAKWGCKVIGQLIRAICVLNFGDARECPYLSPIDDDDDSPKELGEVLESVNTAGFEPTDDAIPQLSDRLGFEVQRKKAPTIPGLFPAAARSSSAGVQARSNGAPADPVDKIAAARAKALGQVYRGAMAPFRAIILSSSSREDCLEKLQAAYADWSPDRLTQEFEVALQVCAAAGAAAATTDGK